MARITHVTYQRVKVVAKYETKRLEATAEVDVLEDPEQVLNDLRQWVESTIDGKATTEAFVPYSRLSDSSKD